MTFDIQFFNIATPWRLWYRWPSVVFFLPNEILRCFMSCHHWWFSLPTCSQRSGWQVVVPDVFLNGTLPVGSTWLPIGWNTYCFSLGHYFRYAKCLKATKCKNNKKKLCMLFACNYFICSRETLDLSGKGAYENISPREGTVSYLTTTYMMTGPSNTMKKLCHYVVISWMLGALAPRVFFDTEMDFQC